LGVEYDVREWRFSIHSSKISLRKVLLHKGDKYAVVPVSYSTHLKETQENLEILLNKIKYKEHAWIICGDLKVLCMFLGH
jgi:hypothetical protein